ncbi:MAG: hypothetical protein GY839_21770 [candidate division Zixibacteria bacterium]|nr:hypothetical protein [candidate division Zixibacteria bacterium]
MVKIIILSALFLSVMGLYLLGCDPGYECDYYIKNQTSDSLSYKLYWRSHDLYQYDGTLETGERKYLIGEGSIGFAANMFDLKAESLFVNDTIRINVEDTTLYRTDKENKHYGKYTVIIKQEHIEQ